MINFEALFNLSYGLYIVSAGDKYRGNAYISNTVFQVTAEPPMFATCCNKDNYTLDFIRRSGAFAVSILHEAASQDLIARLGYHSGRNSDKMSGLSLRYGETGVPIVTDGSLAFMEVTVEQTIDLGTHLMFIGRLAACETLSAEAEPMTYSFYRKVRKGLSPKNAPTFIDKTKLEKPREHKLKRFQCPDCGYIYDEAEEEIRFADLPDDWVCPLCGDAKNMFFEIE